MAGPPPQGPRFPPSWHIMQASAILSFHSVCRRWRGCTRQAWQMTGRTSWQGRVSFPGPRRPPLSTTCRSVLLSSAAFPNMCAIDPAVAIWCSSSGGGETLLGKTQSLFWHARLLGKMAACKPEMLWVNCMWVVHCVHGRCGADDASMASGHLRCLAGGADDHRPIKKETRPQL